MDLDPKDAEKVAHITVTTTTATADTATTSQNL